MARSRLAEELTAERKDRAQVRRSLELLLLLARDVLFVQQGLPPQITPVQIQPAVRVYAERLTVTQLYEHMRQVRVAMERIDQNVDPRLALDALLVAAP